MIGSASDGDTVTVNIGADTGSLTACTTTLNAITGASDAAAAGAVVATINATTGISNLVFASNSGTATITLTGRQKGAGATFATTASSVGATAVVTSPLTSPADATAVGFGLMTERTSSTRAAGTIYTGSAVGTGTYTAQISVTEAIDTAMGTGAAGDQIMITVRGDFDGLGERAYSTTQVYQTSDAATILKAVTALNAMLPAASVVVTGTDVLTFTGERAGLAFSLVGTYSDASAGTTASLDMAASSTANAIPTGGGIALASNASEQNASGVTAYTSGETLSALTEGKIYVLVDDGITIAAGDACFCRVGIATTTTGTLGAFSNVSDSADNIPISAFGFKGVWVGGNITDMNGYNVAPLHISRA